MSRFSVPNALSNLTNGSLPATPGNASHFSPPNATLGIATHQGQQAALAGLPSRRQGRAQQAADGSLSPFLEHVLDATVNPYAPHPGDAHFMLYFEPPPGQPAAHGAAEQFRQQFQRRALAWPGSVRASRADLGMSEHRLAMLDIGGEGQKIDYADGEPMRSGNLHAVNVNAQTIASPGDFHLQTLADAQPTMASRFEIPNLVRPAESWPGPGDRAEGLLPFADGFSNLTMTEGAPVFDYHVAEMSRVTSKAGWMMLAVDDTFADRIGELARQHNGHGEVWTFPPKDGSMNRYVIPPRAALEGGAAEDYRAMWSEASAHDAYDVAQTIALHQTGGMSVAEARQAAPGLRDTRGEIDFSTLGAASNRQHDEL